MSFQHFGLLLQTKHHIGKAKMNVGIYFLTGKANKLTTIILFGKHIARKTLIKRTQLCRLHCLQLFTLQDMPNFK